ncbi:MAG: hypothetical protein H8E56_00050, partial [Candidatus Marinimicrobia bacterium]|nr:hypothetical protein [Candidatus Neomarinimicrobiota bacterium]
MKKLIAILMISTLFAQGPHKMSFQAYLTDGNNMPVAAGNYDMTFRIYDAVTDGNKIWEETQTVSVEGSMINLMLGNTVPLVPFRKAGFLEIQLQDDILSPRQEIGASMFSLRSQMAEIANTAPGYARLDTLSFYAKTSDIVANTDNQALRISGDTLYISNGNAVALDMYKNTFTDSDDQSLKISGDTLYISEGNAVALTPYKDSFTSDQASAIVANTGKTGITASQASEITANTAKTGITADQTTALNAISGTNTGDQDISGITTNATAIALNTAKTGITTDQATAITNNTAKVGVPTAYTLPSVDGSGSQVLQTDGSGAVSWATASG